MKYLHLSNKSLNVENITYIEWRKLTLSAIVYFGNNYVIVEDEQDLQKLREIVMRDDDELKVC